MEGSLGIGRWLGPAGAFLVPGCKVRDLAVLSWLLMGRRWGWGGLGRPGRILPMGLSDFDD